MSADALFYCRTCGMVRTSDCPPWCRHYALDQPATRMVPLPPSHPDLPTWLAVLILALGVIAVLAEGSYRVWKDTDERCETLQNRLDKLLRAQQLAEVADAIRDWMPQMTGALRAALDEHAYQHGRFPLRGNVRDYEGDPEFVLATLNDFRRNHWPTLYPLLDRADRSGISAAREREAVREAASIGDLWRIIDRLNKVLIPRLRGESPAWDEEDPRLRPPPSAE